MTHHLPDYDSMPHVFRYDPGTGHDKLAVMISPTTTLCLNANQARAVVMYAEAIRTFIDSEGAMTSDGAELDSYKGHPLVALPVTSGRPLRFGLNKARAMLDNLPAITEYVAGKDQALAHEMYADLEKAAGIDVTVCPSCYEPHFGLAGSVCGACASSQQIAAD